MTTHTPAGQRAHRRDYARRVEELLLITEAIEQAQEAPDGRAEKDLGDGDGTLTVQIHDAAMILTQRDNSYTRTALVETTMAPVEVLQTLEAAPARACA